MQPARVFKYSPL